MGNLNNVLDEVKNVDKDINNLLIPILQDTIAYTNKHNKRLSLLAILELCALLILVLAFIVFAYKQNIKYHEFLSQFDFQTVENVYQDLDSGEGDINNPTLTNK